MTVEETVEHLTKAWTTTDRDERRRLLGLACRPDAEFLSPHGHNRGTEEYARGIDIFRSSFPKSRTVHGPPTHHHRSLAYRWRTEWNDGRPPLDGIDVGELAEDGRIRRLVSFDEPKALGPPPGGERT